MRSTLMWIVLYLYGIGFAASKLGNALMGGDCHQSTSCYALYAERQGYWFGKIMRPFIDWLFSAIETEHCLKSWRLDTISRKNSVKHMHNRWSHGQPILWRD